MRSFSRKQNNGSESLELIISIQGNDLLFSEQWSLLTLQEKIFLKLTFIIKRSPSKQCRIKKQEGKIKRKKKKKTDENVK